MLFIYLFFLFCLQFFSACSILFSVLLVVFLQVDGKLVQLVWVSVTISVPDILACVHQLTVRCLLAVEIRVAVLVNAHHFCNQLG